MNTLYPWAAIAPCCLLTIGCATQEQTASLQCGGIGGAGSYLACKLMGKSDSDCAKIGLAGAGVGAVACYAYASRLDKRRQALKGRENDLDARLEYMRGLNQDTQQANAELRVRVNDSTQRANELMVQVKQNQATADQLKKERQRLDNDLKMANEQIALQRDALNEVKTYRANQQPRSAELDAEIQKQEQLLAEAQRQANSLASVRERLAS